MNINKYEEAIGKDRNQFYVGGLRPPMTPKGGVAPLKPTSILNIRILITGSLRSPKCPIFRSDASTPSVRRAKRAISEYIGSIFAKGTPKNKFERISKKLNSKITFMSFKKSPPPLPQKPKNKNVMFIR